MYDGGDDYLDSYGGLDTGLDGGLGYDSLDSGLGEVGLGGSYDSFDDGYGYDPYAGEGMVDELGGMEVDQGYGMGFGATQDYSYGSGGGQLAVGGYDDGYLGLDAGLGGEGYLEEEALMESGLPLVHAWGDDLGGWRDDQYALGDLMYYQNTLANERYASDSSLYSSLRNSFDLSFALDSRC